MIVALLSIYQYTRPVPALATTFNYQATASAQGKTESDWPEDGQSALAVEALGIVVTQFADAEPQPIASTTKVMTALLILEAHPLGLTDAGPTIEITRDHSEAYLDAIFNDESAIEVREGEDLNQRQLLDGMLVASANNYARIAAEWDSGSEAAFVGKMNVRASQLGLTATRFADASGLSPDNMSTARDLLVLAQAAMANETFASIVAQAEVTLPVVGEVDSTNTLLNEDGVVGIKTGETDEAGACLIFAADVDTAAGRQRVVGVVLGQPERQQVFERSEELIAAAAGQVTMVRIVSAAQQLGEVRAEWGASAALVSQSALEVAAWPGQQFEVTIEAVALEAPLDAGTVAGELIVRRDGTIIGRVPVVALESVSAPDAGWRLIRD